VLYALRLMGYCREGALLVATWGVFGRRVIRWPASRAAGTGAASGRRWAPCLVGAAMTVHVGVIVATRRRSGPNFVRIVRVTGTRWTILIRPS
jgi:hypothetical protein